MGKFFSRAAAVICASVIVLTVLSGCNAQNALANTPIPTITLEPVSIPTASPTPVPTRKPAPTPIKFPTKGYINAEGVNLRAEMNTDSDVVDILGENAVINVLALEGNWYQIKFESITAYIAKHLVTLGDPPRPDNMRMGTVTRDSTLYYSTSANDIVKDADANPVTITAGTQIRVLRTIGTFCHIAFDGTQRYIVKSNVEFID